MQKGTIVRLKSGGPKMTVDGQNRVTGKFTCLWFEGNKINRDDFDENALEEFEGAASESTEPGVT